MARIESKLARMGLQLPPPLSAPGGVALPFPWVNLRDGRAFVSGHGPQEPDGSLAGPFGKVGAEVSEAEAHLLARKTALSMLGSLRRELGDLDRIVAWNRVFGMVNAAPGFDRMPGVINGFSELIIALWGAEAGRHARSAVGMASLPFGIAVEIEAEVTLG
ncbi:MAG: RidA family protein [Alphaproteobacteria bacterium]|nr:MAG: RidA family protein [Alphaproteobacteria bacterium]